MTNSDMTIRDIRVTMLRMPWADDPWLKGAALGAHRDILICEVETAGGITGMGYLFHFRPGLRSIATFIDEVIVPRMLRIRLARALDMLRDKREKNPAKKHGNIPL